MNVPFQSNQLRALLCAAFLSLLIVSCSSDSNNSSSSSSAVTPSLKLISFNLTQTLSSIEPFSASEVTALADTTATADARAEILSTALETVITDNPFINLDFFIPNTETLHADFENFLEFVETDEAKASVSEAILQGSLGTAQKNIFVLAAGNSVNQTLAAFYSDLATNATYSSSIITVGGYQTSNIGEYYNPNNASTLLTNGDIHFDNCGDTSARCLVAPTSNTLIDQAIVYRQILDNQTDITPSELGRENYANLIEILEQGAGSGTSFVTVGLTYINSFFNDTLTSQEVADRALASGNLEGCNQLTGTTNASVCGQGVLDVLAAIEEIGTTSLQFGPSINSYSVKDNNFFISLGNSNLQPNSAALDAQPVVVIDSFGAPFTKSLSDHINIETGSSFAAIHRPGSTHRYSNIERLTDLSSFNQDVAFQHGSKVQNSKGIAFFNDASIASVSSLRQYESHCFSSCLMSDESMSFIVGDLVQASIGNGKSSLSFAGCLGEGDLSCAVLGGKTSLTDNIILKTSLVAAKQDHSNTAVNDQWFGVNVGSSLTTSDLSQSESTISKVGVDYQVTDSFNVYVEVEDTQSEWNSLAALSLLENGAINYQRQFAGVEWFKPSQHIRLQLTQHQIDESDNFLKLNVPVSRSKNGSLIYDQFNLPLSTIVDSEFSVLYYLSLANNSNKQTQLSFVMDTPVDSSLRSDYSEVKLALQHSWK